MKRSVAFAVAAVSAFAFSSAVSAQDAGSKSVWCVPRAPQTPTVVQQCRTSPDGTVVDCTCPASYVLVVPQPEFENGTGGSPVVPSQS